MGALHWPRVRSKYNDKNQSVSVDGAGIIEHASAVQTVS